MRALPALTPFPGLVSDRFMTFDLHTELRKFDPDTPIESAWTPPSSWYTSVEMYEAERSAVFGRTWQPLVRVEELGEEGSYVSGCLAGEPWVVVRNVDGSVGAYYNVCRHKGREVVQGSGKAEELVCGYHAWTYRLDGQLRSAPKVAGIQGFNREAMGLVPLQTEIWGPWVFVNQDPLAPPLAGELRELQSRLEAGGWEDLRFHSRKTWDIACNWKVVADNYLDGGYHIPHMHPSLDAQLDMDSYRTELFGAYSVQSSMARAPGDTRTRVNPETRIGPGALYAWIYPNFAINRYGPCMDTNLVLPRGPEQCTVVYDFFFEKSGGEDAVRFVEESIRQSDITQREDIAICESVQVGLRSRSYESGRYAPRLETGDHHFHRLLYRDLVRDLIDGAREPRPDRVR